MKIEVWPCVTEILYVSCFDRPNQQIAKSLDLLFMSVLLLIPIKASYTNYYACWRIQ